MAGVLFNAIGTIVIFALTIYIALQILPVFLDIVKTAVFFTPDATTKDLAGLITISGAATQKITILYPISNMKYNVYIGNRLVSTEILDDKGNIAGKSPPSKIAIDPNADLKSISSVKIEKTFTNYGIEGT